MSNFIPFVSSSPPPLDLEDGQAAGWDDDEDDDFGNFASAPAAGFSTSDYGSAGGLGFDVDWSKAGSADVQSEGRGSSPDKGSLPSDQETSDENRGVPPPGRNEMAENATDSQSKFGLDLERKGGGDAVLDGDDDDDDFADFAAFQGDSNGNSKPQVGSLALQSTHQEKMEAGKDGECAEGRTAETVMEKSRESTTTDSGVFSTDMSPVPKSESFSISEGDRIVQSEDETFSELPQDNQQQSLSPADGGPAADSLSSDSVPHKGQELEPKQEMGFESRSDTPRNEEGTEVSASDESEPFSKQEEQGQQLSDSETQNQEESGVSEQEHTDSSGSPSLPRQEHKQDRLDCDHLSSGGLAGSDQETVSSQPVELAGRDSTERKADLIDGSDVTVGDAKDTSPLSSDSPAVVKGEESSSKDVSADEDVRDDSDRASFEASASTPPVIPDSENGTDSQNVTEPEDLVLRTNSVEFDAEEVSDEVDDFGDFSAQPAVDLPASQKEDAGEAINNVGDPCGHPDPEKTIPAEGSGADSGEKVPGNEGNDEDDFGEFASKEASQGQKKEEDFGDFSSREASSESDDKDKKEGDDFGDFSSGEVTSGNNDEDDFGDFSSQPLSSAAPAPSSGADDFGAFSGQSAGAANDDDDFGNFSGQTGSGATASADSDWADFAGPSTSKSDAEEGDFGHFSDTKPAAVQDSMSAFVSSSSPRDNAQGNKFEKVLQSCFPGSAVSQAPLLPEEPECGDTAGEAETESAPTESSKSKVGMLETILEYGLRHRSASQQTWQVVQHPAKKDPRVKLWGHLQDMDGSPAVVYQWGKSSANSHLFSTLHIDTQNMLIGHKKPSVPIFATGLSLLEPIRGGARERGLGVGGQSVKGTSPSTTTHAPTLVDPSQRDAEPHTQEIPAVDFDWSTSGLTNPLTSKSLDLDFLVVQDSDASEKPSVFQSEILDAPRSNVKSSQPLEDILKNAKPTSVRSRHNDAAVSQMSPEAARVLAGLPNLTFMQSKVLMFPIKN